MDEKSVAARQKKQAEQKQEAATERRHKESLAKIDALATSNLQIMRSFVAYLNKTTSKTEVTNQLESIATPDALKVVAIIKKLDKTVADKKIDWKPMQEALKPVVAALEKQANKKDPEAVSIPEVNYEKIAEGFGAAIEKLAAPVVNLPAPIVNVPKGPAPIINTEKVDLKPFVDEVLQVLTDFRVWTQDQIPEPVSMDEVEKLLTKANDTLKKIEKKNFGGGGGGGGGGYVFKASPLVGDGSQPLVAPTLDEFGRIVVAAEVEIPPITVDSTPTFKDDPTDAVETPKYGKTNSTTHKQQVEAAVSGSLDIDNFPTEYPLPASQITTLTPPAAITGFATSAKQDAEATLVGPVNETAPVSDTASSGLNGRLQRVSQRLTSVIALLPGSLGQKARAVSLAVTLSTEDVTALTPPAAITGFATATKQDDQSALIGAVNESAPASDTANSGLNGRLQRVAQRITSLIALLPSSIGQKNKAGSLSVTLASDQDAITANPTTPSTLLAFITTVATAGTRVQLASNASSAFIVEAPSTNTGNVYIGGSNVSATVFGAELQPGQSAGIAVDNTNKVYIDAATNGDKVALIGS